MPSTALADRLEDIATAAAASDPSAVKAAVDEFEAELQAIRVSESVLRERATTIRDTADVDPETRQSLDDLVRSLTAIPMSRAGVLTTGAFYVADPSRVEDEQLVETARDLAEEERALVEQVTETESSVESVDIPPTLAVVGLSAPSDPQPLGETFTVTATVANVGDDTATGVELRTTGDYPATPDTVEVGRLDGGERQTVTLEFTGDATGERRVGVRVESSEIDAVTRSTDVTVLDSTGFLDRAVGTVADVRSDLDDTFAANRAKPIDTKLDRATERIEDARTALDGGRRTQAENSIETASNVLGACLNQLYGWNDDSDSSDRGTKRSKGNGNSSGNGAPETDGIGLVIGSVESVIDLLATALVADD